MTKQPREQTKAHDLPLEKQLAQKDAELIALREDLADADRRIRNQARYLNTLRAERVVVEQEMRIETHKINCYRCQNAENMGACAKGAQLGAELRRAIFNRNERRDQEQTDNEPARWERRTQFGKASRSGAITPEAIKNGWIRSDAGDQKGKYGAHPKSSNKT